MFLNQFLRGLFLANLMIGCHQSPPLEQPNAVLSDDYIKTSQAIGKERVSQENKVLEQWLKTNKETQFIKTNSAYWIKKVVDNDNPLPKETQLITYNMDIRQLDSTVIYSYGEIGTKNLILGKNSEIRGVEHALRQLSAGEEAVLLLPSFMGYGLYGDDNKIGAYVPLLINIKVKQIKDYKL